jgi:hypothetical protein
LSDAFPNLAGKAQAAGLIFPAFNPRFMVH